ncbi:hypothetical protein ACFXGA_16960, partial [Actinosynnema sp. NPDC059335]|uniref:hypothetical protein n=1 Tax=Actinosynnema sp. NPDC059335 TaxID=3346804 RepID=UPI0036732BE7
MTLLLASPRNWGLLLHLGFADRVRRLLADFLAPAPCRARHRALSPARIRWQRWKAGAVRTIATVLGVGPVPLPAAARGPARAAAGPAAGCAGPPPPPQAPPPGGGQTPGWGR